MRQLVILLLSLTSIACYSPRFDPVPEIEVIPKVSMPAIIQWSEWEEKAGERWLAEAKKRFKDPIILCCHGTTMLWMDQKKDGSIEAQATWMLAPDKPRVWIPVAQVARTLRNLYPNKDIVLIVCNADGHDLDIPGVWYAKKKVWMTPEGHLTVIRDPSIVGSIWEFQGKPLKP